MKDFVGRISKNYSEVDLGVGLVWYESCVLTVEDNELCPLSGLKVKLTGSPSSVNVCFCVINTGTVLSEDCCIRFQEVCV